MLELAAARDLRHAEGRTLAGNFIFASLGEVVVGEALVRKFGDGFNFCVGPDDHDHAREFAAILFKVFLLLDVDANALAGDDAVGAGSPGFRVDDERDNVGRGHAGVDVLIGPSAAEGPPRLEVRVAQAHGGELVASPLVGALHVGRSGEPFADRIHQAGGKFHDFGIAEAFVANAGDGLEINLLLRLHGGNQREKQRDGTDEWEKLLHR